MPTALVTSGPTREKIDPVRFISNYSSGKQGHAIAKALADKGFEVTLVTGPVNIPSPKNVKVINIETAEEMLKACISSLPVDVAVCVAAVCDFRPENTTEHKIKKQSAIGVSLNLVQNPDILKTISNHPSRPKIVVGFAAETDNLIVNAKDKLQKKGCDIIVANNVSNSSIFGSEETTVTIITKNKVEPLGTTNKGIVADEIADRITKLL